MAHSVSLSCLNELDTGGVVALARRLTMDMVPCSFWGLDQQAVDALIMHPNKLTIVASIEDQVVGIGVLARGESYQRHLGELSVAVCPSQRRQGIAKSILSDLVSHAQVLGIDILKALVWTENHPSRQLFEALGFEHRATLYGEFKSPEFGVMDDCVYYKTIPANRLERSL
ncbi:MAG: GNAT family N-acetyltransferase [Herpetosiphonaceae bacterium]|nr:GNAT family N-acetyltransferase [Herpetosiphonaceae bacterium]